MNARYQTTNFKKLEKLEKKLPILYYKQQLYSTLKNINVLVLCKGVDSLWFYWLR